MPPSPQTKDTASSVVQRRDLSTLLSENRSTSARIRVENVIATDTAVEVMEMVELYCELLLARANLLDQSAFGEKGARARRKSSSGSGFSFWGFGGRKQTHHDPRPEPEVPGGEVGGEKEGYIDPALDEAAAVIFYSYARFPHDVREMTILRGLLTDRWGKDFMMLAQENKLEDVKVPERLVRGLRVKPPSEELVESYLVEIARAYGVTWPDGSHDAPEGDVPSFVDEGAGGDEGDDGGEDDEGDMKLPSTPRKIGQSGDSEEARRASETLELNKATPPRGLYSEGKSPVSVAPPGPRVDNLHPKVKVPGEEDVSKEASKSKPAKSDIPELDELTRRFAALRR
ncbi:Gar1/Naf1 RNA binding region family protein [Aspergillus niger]|uniref:Gar1/Naf1 RNA binding region family protein n=1 Tax=Aspergillus niger TaxID=5061 RepID=A0A505I2S7_ASPNG|nr:Gar1/Naf1 RNA binding region family protein [Aspergillus niger]